jgi:dolichol-phosphate mannosyltransferase
VSAPERRVLVIVPTYDESANLASITARLRAAVPEAGILVVDDASPDGTGELADRLAADDPAIHVLHRPRKAGLGAAYIAGFRWGLQAGYHALVEMDADGSHQPEQLPRLLDALDGADLVLGARWVPGGEVRNWPLSRTLLSRGGNAYTRLLLGVPFADATGGFRVFRRTVLEALPLDEIASQGYCFQVDLAWRAWLLGFRVREVPITFVERVAGSSKMSRGIVAEALAKVTVWGVRSRRSRARRRPPPGGFDARTKTRPRARGGSDTWPGALGNFLLL